MKGREPIEPDDAVTLLPTPAERDAALSIEVLLPECLEDNLRLGVSKAGQLEFMFTLEELDELQGCLAAAANHTKSRKLQRNLDAVFDKIERLLDAAHDNAAP
jgi:hypothetical protein